MRKPFSVSVPTSSTLDQLVEGRRHAGRYEDLSALGLAAEPRGKIRDGADGAVVPAPFEADGADGGVALGDPHAEGEVVPALLPDPDQMVDALAHGQRHADGALGGIRHGHRDR